MTDEIYTLELRLLDPAVRKSAEELDKLLADCFWEIGASGQIYTKREIVEALRDEIVDTSWTLHNFKICLLAPELIMATYRSECSNHSNETSYALRSSLWRQTGSSWRMIFHQGTPCLR